MSKPTIFKGMRRGKIIVLEKFGFGSHSSEFLCRCDCGKEFYCKSSKLSSTSLTFCCGCSTGIKYTDTINSTRLYSRWKGIRARCRDLNNNLYGGRGIIIYEPWRINFVEFCRYMYKLDNNVHEKIENGFEIDRIDNDGNYCPGNIRLITKKENARNQRQAYYIKYSNGSRKCLAEVCEDLAGLIENKTIEEAKEILFRLFYGYELLVKNSEK